MLNVLDRTRNCLLLAIAVVAGGCTLAYGIERRAPCDGLSFDRLREAVSSDPLVTTTLVVESGRVIRIGTQRRVGAFYCDREGWRACVELLSDPAEVDVCISRFNRRPSAEEVPVWTERVESLCRAISAKCPEVGAWENRDFYAPPSRSRVLAGLGLVAAILAVATGVLVLVARRRRRLRARAAVDAAGDAV